jgi:hypothetical protein
MGGGITDVDRGICEAPTGLDSPGFYATLLRRMQDLVDSSDWTARTLVWDDVGASFRTGEPPPRAMLEGGRQFATDEQRLYYLRYVLQMEIEQDNLTLNPSGEAKNKFRIAQAMTDYELKHLKSVVDRVAPLPAPSTPYVAPMSDRQAAARGLVDDWSRMAAQTDRAEYEAYLAEVALAQTEPPEPPETHVFTGAYTVDAYQQYIGGPYQAMVARGMEVAPVFVSLALDFVPVAGQLKAVLESIVGKDIITGRELEPWERGLGLLLAVIPEARGIFKAGRTGLRVLARGALKRGVATEEAYRVARTASRMSEAEVGAARKVVNGKPANPREFEKVAGSIDEMTGSKSRGFRAAAGVIEDGRGLSRAVAGSPIDPVKIAAKEAKIAKAVKKATKIPQKIAGWLTRSGIPQEAITALERAGVQLSEDAALLIANDAKAVAFIRDFHQCPGFALVVEDFVRGQTKNKGAKFLMEFVTDSANKIDPRLTKFELPVGITKGARGDRASRLTDLVITQGNRTINLEFKAYSKVAVSLIFRDQKKLLQLVKDVKMLGRENIKWVFDSRDVSRSFVYKQFKNAIKSDPVLAREFGDAEKLEKALDDLIVMFPPEPGRLGLPASAPVKAAGAATDESKKGSK